MMDDNQKQAARDLIAHALDDKCGGCTLALAFLKYLSNDNPHRASAMLKSLCLKGATLTSAMLGGPPPPDDATEEDYARIRDGWTAKEPNT